MAAKRRVAVLISGRGSNLQALIEATRDPAHAAELVLVISNEPEAAGLSRAAASGIATDVVSHRDFAGRPDFEAALTARLESAGAEFVCLAGFMRVLTDGFVERWRDRLVNIHPSLLPAFPGLDTHARALEAGVKVHGCTVHFVRSEVDAGPIIGQAAVPVLPDDTPASLAERVLAAEHRLYPRCLDLVADGRVRITGKTATADVARPPDWQFLNPPAAKP